MNSFDLLEFNEENLSIALSNRITSPNQVKRKNHFLFFYEYFNSGLLAKTIVVEKEYISKSYLLDYSNFYSTSFNNYERVCNRVHFFAEKTTAAKFTQSILDNESDNLAFWNSYLGYIVVKPLPGAKIGATILKTYEKSKDRLREFPATRIYKINLFGKNLFIRSLAYQEQDTVVSTCSTSALWSAFQITSQLFQTSLPSPSEITKSSKNLFTESGKVFPNKGFDIFQIGNTIDSVGLAFELRNRKEIKNIKWLKAFVYAYNRMGLPVILGTDLKFARTELSDGHLLTIVGYRADCEKVAQRKGEILLKSDQLVRLYAHDDQIGPFSRIGFSTDKIVTSWIDKDNQEKVLAEVATIIVPITHKVRLTFEDIYSKIRILDFIFLTILPEYVFVWDVYLDYSNNYKEELFGSYNDSRIKAKLLTKPLARYIWIAKAMIGTEVLFDFIFDATEIESSDYCLSINIYNSTLKDFVKNKLTEDDFCDFIEKELSYRYLELLKKECDFVDRPQRRNI